MAQHEISHASVKTIRTTMLLAGILIGYTSFLVPNALLALIIFIAGMGLIMWGCYLWTKIKGRHWAWMLFGLLAPIGLLALALISSNKTTPPTTDAGS